MSPLVTTLPVIDFNKIWDSGLSFLGSIDIAAGVANLATMRGSAVNPPAPQVIPDPMYTGASKNPAWKVMRGPFDMQEQLLPVVCLDIDRTPHERPRDSGDNYHQEWIPQMLLMLAARGKDRIDVERRVIDAFSVLGQAWMGLGAKFGDPSIAVKTGMQTSWFEFEALETEVRDEGLQSVLRATMPIDSHFVMIRT